MAQSPTDYSEGTNLNLLVEFLTTCRPDPQYFPDNCVMDRGAQALDFLLQNPDQTTNLLLCSIVLSGVVRYGYNFTTFAIGLFSSGKNQEPEYRPGQFDR